MGGRTAKSWNSYLSRSDASKDNWETPTILFKQIDSIYGTFDLDASVSDGGNNAKVANYITESEDALSIEWSTRGKRIWCNPPYKGIETWLEKAIEAREQGSFCCLLAHVRSDTRWWHSYVMKANEIVFIKSRIRFVSAESRETSNSPFPSCLLIFDPAQSGPIKVSVLEQKKVGA
jgi:phage N-6-adenine-methyltransferase